MEKGGGHQRCIQRGEKERDNLDIRKENDRVEEFGTNGSLPYQKTHGRIGKSQGGGLSRISEPDDKGGGVEERQINEKRGRE